MYPAFKLRVGCLVRSVVPGGQSTGIIRLMVEPGQLEVLREIERKWIQTILTYKRRPTRLKSRLLGLSTALGVSMRLPTTPRQPAELCRRHH